MGCATSKRAILARVASKDANMTPERLTHLNSKRNSLLRSPLLDIPEDQIDSPSSPPSPAFNPLDAEERSKVVRRLCNSARSGTIKVLSRLLSTDKGRACINDGGELGLTPIHFATYQCGLEAIKLLVEKGAEVDPVSNDGTPLTIAAQYGYESIAEYLLSKGASKAKAIKTAPKSEKALVEGFFVDFERLVKKRLEFKAKRVDLDAKVRKSDKPETLPTTCKGITIGGLKKLKALIQSECRAGRFKEDKSFRDGTNCKGCMKYEQLTTTDVVYRFVKDESVTGHLRLIDKPGVVAPEHKALPTFFISHAWKGRFSVLLDQIFAYALKNELSDDMSVWIDLFGVNQHGSRECSQFSQTQNRADVSAFKDVVQTCIDGTLVVCDFKICITSTRAWCLYEWDWTMFYHGREKLQFLGLSKKEAEEGKGIIDVEKAVCFNAQDKEMILREVVDKHGSTEVFNQKLQNKWVDVQFGLG